MWGNIPTRPLFKTPPGYYKKRKQKIFNNSYQEDTMRNKTITALVLFILFSFNHQSHAGDRTVNGLIIGGGTGALVGQVIGRNVESTVFGATVGGILGAVIGSSGSQHSHQKSHQSVIVYDGPRGPHGREFNYKPRHGQPQVVFSQPHINNSKYYKKKHKPKNVRYNNCKPSKGKTQHKTQYRNESRDRRHQFR
jgi:uncharacterized protein YcfJ